MELHLGMDEELTKRFWTRIKGRGMTAHITLGTTKSQPTMKIEQMRPSIDGKEHPHVQQGKGSI